MCCSHCYRGDKVERARLQKADNEHTFGFQMATNVIDEGIGAAKLAYESGASWVDLNCGCPIYGEAPRCCAVRFVALLLAFW